MRKEIYRAIAARLFQIAADGSIMEPAVDAPGEVEEETQTAEMVEESSSGEDAAEVHDEESNGDEEAAEVHDEESNGDEEAAEVHDEESGGGEEAAEVQKEKLIKYVDLWNHNVEFLDQEQPWERPAVFVEFSPIVWELVKPGEYRAKPVINLHVVTDWAGDASSASELQEEALSVLDYSAIIHRALCGLEGEHFGRLDLIETHTNHNHDELVESVEVYRCVIERKL